MMKKHLLLFFLLLPLLSVRAQMVAVNTDMLMDVLQIPNMGVEIVVGERSVAGLHAFGSYRPWGKDVRVLGLQSEYRYFFSGRPMNSFFVGFGLLASSYDITWAGKVYDGNAFGAGMTFGYVLPLTHRLNLDFHAGFGAIFYRQKEYFEGDFYDQDYSTGGLLRPNATGYTLLPTRVGVSLSYILK